MSNKLQRTWAIEFSRNCHSCVKDWDLVSNNHSSQKLPVQIIVNSFSSKVLIERVPVWIQCDVTMYLPQQDIQCVPSPLKDILTCYCWSVDSEVKSITLIRRKPFPCLNWTVLWDVSYLHRPLASRRNCNNTALNKTSLCPWSSFWKQWPH